MKYIIIGTTAINRPELHNDNILEWYEWIKKDNDYRFIWFINIDIIEKLDVSYKKTEDNFKMLLQYKIDELYFLKNPDGKGNFLEACKRLIVSMNMYIDNLIQDKSIEEKDLKILWLEDDWKLNIKTNISFTNLVEKYSIENSHINLTYIRRNYIWALAPSILTYGFWKKVHYTFWINQNKHIDPEHCLGVNYLKNNTPNNKDISICNLTILNKIFDVEKFINEPNSYYTYYEFNDTQIINTKFVPNDNLNFQGRDIFIRITPTLVLEGCNYGRNFMEDRKLYKKGIQNNENIDFYKNYE